MVSQAEEPGREAHAQNTRQGILEKSSPYEREQRAERNRAHTKGEQRELMRNNRLAKKDQKIAKLEAKTTGMGKDWNHYV